MTRRLLLLATALIALLVLPTAAEAARGTGNASPDDILHNPRLLARYLRLNETQAGTLRELLSQLHATVRPLAQQQKELYEELYEALEAASPDACAIGNIRIDIYELGEQIRDAYQAFDTAFSAILTPEQLARYEALKEAARRFGRRDD